MKRICVTCGKEVVAGMTDSYHLYCHEGKCFTKYMNKICGKHKWMRITKGDEYGGSYLVADDTVACGYRGTGIFHTEWNNYTECVEPCPHCGKENIYKNYNVKKDGYIVRCKECGRKIFLCDECLHADDNKCQKCDWHETKKGKRVCFRGKINKEEKED